MMFYNGTFSEIYRKILKDITPFLVNFNCNENKMLYEMMNIELNIKMLDNNISIYSHELTKALPIVFTLAEFLTHLTDDGDITHLCKMNKNMINYCREISNNRYFSDHYGIRLYEQLPNVLHQLKNDKYTRQACANIWEHSELYYNFKSCNVFLQFIIRDNKLNLIVISRSSDLLTGLQIDAFIGKLC